MKTTQIEKWWNEASEDYQRDSTIGTDSAHYGPYSSNENKLKLLGSVKGKKILEIGCGGGQCSIAFAKRGAKCTGLDISQKQIEYARDLAKKNRVNVNFLKHDIQKLTGFKSKTYDIVFSAWSLQYIKDLRRCFEEVYRVLKDNGLFVFSLGHPFYDVLSPKTFKVNKSYNKLGKEVNIETWPDGTKHTFIRYKRKVSEIYEALYKSGFIVEEIMEPFVKNSEKAWLKGYWKRIYPIKLVELIGPTIIFKARVKKRKA